MNLSKTRSINYLNQLKGSALYKVGAIASTFLALPIMIKYLGAEQFGVWATMLTLITWVMLFDLGIGNGLKNKISESLVQNNNEQAGEYVSTAYCLVGLISLTLFILFLVVTIWLPWQSIFNTKVISEFELKISVVTLSFFIFFNFWISLVNQIYHSLQKSSVVVMGQFISNITALIFILIIYKFSNPSIIFLVCSYGFSLVFANILLSAILFKKLKFLMPAKKKFKYEKVKSLLSLGIKFFFIQLAVLVIFMSDKILITQLLGPEHVTPYEVLFKLFSVITIVHSMIQIPLWPAYSDAYNRGDFEWIRRNIKQQINFAFLLFAIAFILAIIGPEIIDIWIGGEFSAPSNLYFMFALFIVFSVWSNVFAYVVNSMNKLNLQLCTAIVAAIVNIPLSVYFVRTLNMGLEGILLATVVSLSIFSFLGPIQVYRILKEQKE